MGWGDITVRGADELNGKLHITADTTINLAETVDGTWDDDKTSNVLWSGTMGCGFKYSSVTIDEGVLLSFFSHPCRVPVTGVVNGNMIIDDTLSLNG